MPASTAGNKRAIFRQVCELIPPHLVPKLARKHEIKSRGIMPWMRIPVHIGHRIQNDIGH
jgi:hypothetical protein